MATLIGKFVNSTWSSSANWTDRSSGLAASPADGDELQLVSNDGVSAITGSDESGTELISIDVGPAFDATLGTSGSQLLLSCPRINWNGRSESAWMKIETHAYTDLAIDASDNTIISSAGQPFTDAHVGLKIKITGGTGFTTGTYEILSVNSGDATLDAAAGTTGSTSGTGHFQISLTVQNTATIDADEIATKGLHLKCNGAADLLDPKFDSGYITLELEVSTGTVVGTLYSTATLLHNYMTLGNATEVEIASSSGSTFVNWKPSASGPTLRISTGGVFDQYQTSLTIPVSGPAIIVEGGTLRWFASALIGSIRAKSGAVDFSEAQVPFQIDGVTIIEEATLNIANGIRTPTFAGGLHLRGKNPDLATNGNLNLAVTYVK